MYNARKTCEKHFIDWKLELTPERRAQLQPLMSGKTSQSGYVGVSRGRGNRWQAQVDHRAIGGYPTAYEAGVNVTLTLIETAQGLFRVPSASNNTLASQLTGLLAAHEVATGQRIQPTEPITKRPRLEGAPLMLSAAAAAASGVSAASSLDSASEASLWSTLSVSRAHEAIRTPEARNLSHDANVPETLLLADRTQQTRGAGSPTTFGILGTGSASPLDLLAETAEVLAPAADAPDADAPACGGCLPAALTSAEPPSTPTGSSSGMERPITPPSEVWQHPIPLSRTALIPLTHPQPTHPPPTHPPPHPPTRIG